VCVCVCVLQYTVQTATCNAGMYVDGREYHALLSILLVSPLQLLLEVCCTSV
jgi:hypothetical protein